MEGLLYPKGLERFESLGFRVYLVDERFFVERRGIFCFDEREEFFFLGFIDGEIRDEMSDVFVHGLYKWLQVGIWDIP